MFERRLDFGSHIGRVNLRLDLDFVDDAEHATKLANIRFRRAALEAPVDSSNDAGKDFRFAYYCE